MAGKTKGIESMNDNEGIQGSPQIAELAGELKARLDAGNSVSGDDLATVINVLLGQDNLIAVAVASADRLELLLKMARTFSMSEFVLPSHKGVTAFLREYIDDRMGQAILWPPPEMGDLATFLRDNGYTNINGFVAKVESPKAK